MKNVALATLLLALLAMPFPASAQSKAPPQAQAQPPAAAPAQKSAQPVAPVTAAPATAQAMPMARATRRVPSTADARVCLEFQDNLQVMKCAEKYRWAS